MPFSAWAITLCEPAIAALAAMAPTNVRRDIVPLFTCPLSPCRWRVMTTPPQSLRGLPKMNLVISVSCGMMVVESQSSRHNMWTEITRRKYEREGQRYASDLTEAEWALIAPHMPAVKRLGRPRETELRRVFDFFFQAEDGIRDADVTGVQTCALPI